MTKGPPSAQRASAEPGFGWRALAVTFAIASAIGLAFASQMVLFTTSIGRRVPWPAALTSGLIDTWLWVPLVPAIFVVARRFPFSARRWPLDVGVHLAAALAATALFSAAQLAVTTWLIPDTLRPAMFFKGFRPGPGPGSGPGPGAGPLPAPPPREGRTDRLSPDPHPDRGPRPGDPDADRGWRSPDFYDRFRLGLMSRLHLHFLTYVGVVGAWHWLAQQHRLRERERQAQELSRQLAEARLQALRMQLNPHFLFNTLNAIATLLHRDPRAADEMVTCLSDFLRLTLGAANTPENPLQKELEFARCYLDIEKVRFGERLVIEEDIPIDCLGVAVPTLVLQPLLENAVRHGIERNERQGRIDLRARRDGDEFRLTISDTGPGLASGSPGPPPPAHARTGGIGLSNTRARLRELHGDAASLSLRERETGGLDVELRLPWRLAPAPPSA